MYLVKSLPLYNNIFCICFSAVLPGPIQTNNPLRQGSPKPRAQAGSGHMAGREQQASKWSVTCSDSSSPSLTLPRACLPLAHWWHSMFTGAWIRHTWGTAAACSLWESSPDQHLPSAVMLSPTKPAPSAKKVEDCCFIGNLWSQRPFRILTFWIFRN